MRTFYAKEVNTALALRVAIREVTRHDGRFFVGKHLRSRKEMRTGLEALNTWIDQPPFGGGLNLYLTPKPVNSRKTKQDKWNEACNVVQHGLTALRSLQTDAELWLRKLTRRGNQNTVDLLTQVSQLKIEAAQEMIDEANTIVFPKGFGRD